MRATSVAATPVASVLALLPHAPTLLALVEHSSDMIGLADLEGRLQWMNRAGRRMIGLDPDAPLEPMDIASHVAPEWRAALRDEVLPAVRATGHWEGIMTLVHLRTGARIDVSRSAFLVRDPVTGEPVGFGTVTRDITTREDAARAARAYDRRFRQLFERIDLGFCVIRILFDADRRPVDYRFLEVNATFEEQSGLRAPTGRTARELVPDLDEFWFRTYGGVALTRRPVRFENHAPAMGRWFDVYAFPFDADDPDLVALVFSDITGRHAHEAALREADRRKDDFLAMLAHELRNPLAPVRHAIEILKRVEPGAALALRAREIIERQVSHMSRLIDDLLDVSRIARGQVTLRRLRCDLADIVRATAESYRPTLQAAGLVLQLELPVTPTWIDGDQTRLSQVVANLLHNAGKFTPRGGLVTVALTSGGDPQAPIATLTVCDTGIGLAPELRARLFEPFAQGEQALDREQGGLGLGLALVHGLVAMHGGTVSAASDGPGTGATFTVQLPLATMLADETPPPPVAPAELPLSVLVIEDHADAAEMLRDLLVLAGHTVRVARDGDEALVLARDERPDVMLCDIGLPGAHDGYAVARAVRDDPALAGIFLVALSGYGRDDDLQRAADAGFDRHLVKPADRAALAQVLGEAAASVPP
ncbi:MAG: ATP-binding protein [Gemmatimonadaceae bacterium]|nr:ATP-binding protein [Gemmatimonadaceae bacterium]